MREATARSKADGAELEQKLNFAARASKVAAHGARAEREAARWQRQEQQHQAANARANLDLQLDEQALRGSYEAVQQQRLLKAHDQGRFLGRQEALADVGADQMRAVDARFDPESVQRFQQAQTADDAIAELHRAQPVGATSMQAIAAKILAEQGTIVVHDASGNVWT